MKTMSLCAIAFACLLFVIARGLFAGDPITAYIVIFLAAACWALMMWAERATREPAKDEDDDGLKLCAQHGIHAGRGCAACEADIDWMTRNGPPNDECQPPGTVDAEEIRRIVREEVRAAATPEWFGGPR